MLGPPTASLFPAARHLSGLAIVVRNPSISRWHRHPDGGPAIHIFRCSIAETEQHLRSSQGGTCATHFWKLYSPNPPHIFENATIGNGIGAHPAGALIMSAFGSFRSLRGLWCAGGEATVGYELLASKKRRFV